MDRIDLTEEGMTVDKAYRSQDYTDILKKYRDPATVYAYLVLSGKQEAGEKTKLDCFRHLQDLKRVEDPDVEFKYHYDLKECKKILNFARLVPEPALGVPIPLMPWQKRILCMMKGWRDEYNRTRFSKVSVSVGRANGKSYIASILVWHAYLIECAGLNNQDIGYVQPTSSQLVKPWNYVKTMGIKLKDIPAIHDEFVQTGTYIGDMGVKSALGNKVLRLSNESGQFDSFHFRFCVVDESGDEHFAHSPNIGKITQGQSHVPGSQLMMISTSYENTETLFCKDQHRLVDVMKRDYDRTLDSYLCLAWQQDSLDELNSPETWIKSNPLLGIDNDGSILKRLIDDRDAAIADGSVNEFQNKNLNNWLSVKQNSYVKLEDLQKAVISHRDFKTSNRTVYIGYDKGQFSDDNAIAFVYPYQKDGENLFHIEQFSFIPLRNANNDINVKEHQDGIQYRVECDKGYGKITENEFGIVQDDEVYDWLLNYVAEHELDVKGFCYDFYHETSMIKMLMDNTEWVCIPVHQGTKSLNEPTCFFRDQLSMRRITMLDDGILQYSLKNALLFQDNNGLKINKDKGTAKIDCVDALIDAFYEAMYYFDNVSNVKTKSVWSNKTNDEINDYLASDDFSF